MHKGKTKSHVLEGFLKAEHRTKNHRFRSLTQPAGLGVKLSEPRISYLQKKKKKNREEKTGSYMRLKIKYLVYG